MPPQGLLLIANYLPEEWPVRFIDENMGRAKASDFEWAEVVLVTGMHIQGGQIRDICDRARAAGKVTVLRGPRSRRRRKPILSSITCTSANWETPLIG